MTVIKLADLSAPGAELFSDSESYLNEVSDSELLNIKGGSTPLFALGIAAAALSYKITHEWTT